MPSPVSRRSPRAARPAADLTRPAERPPIVLFAAVFGMLVAAEDGYLAWLLWNTRPAFVVLALLCAAGSLLGAVLAFLGRPRGWLVLALTSVPPMLGLLTLALLLGALGAGRDVALALLLVAGPVGCLVLALQRPVRQWSGRRAPGRSGGGRRWRGVSG